MSEVAVIVFHRPPRPGDPPLTGLLARAREALLGRQIRLFAEAGASRVVLAAARDTLPDELASVAATLTPRHRTVPVTGVATPGASFGDALAALVHRERFRGCVVLGSGSVPRLHRSEARHLVAAAASGRPLALTNNRYSSDICAVARAAVLADLPSLPSDNALPRWLEEVAGYPVAELPGRTRLALDLDTPLDLALLALAPEAPPPLRRLAEREGIRVPRLEQLRSVAGDPRRELLVFGRGSSRTLAWLERHVRCRVRFLAEERGLRAGSPLAMRPGALRSAAESAGPRAPRATLGRLLADRGPAALGSIVADLADAALLDSRVLLADRLGADEATWPSDEDRFASDLLQPDGIHDSWLRGLTAAAAGASLPIVLGGHTLVGPGARLVCRGIR